MIQDIFPSRLDIAFSVQKARGRDFLLFFDREGRLLVSADDGNIRFTRADDFPDAVGVYLFSLDGSRFFLARGEDEVSADGFGRYTVRELRDRCCGKELFAAFTAYHLWKWYDDNRYCGRCRGELLPKEDERALRCTQCGSVIYPRINPAVIVGVIKGDSLLITRYRRGYAHNALVAGFTEIGETLEQTVEREVMEETGIKVKNIRYYKSQPWGMAQDILVGFFCEADGDCEIKMDESELRYAEWVLREDIVLQPNALSLTNEMMSVFRDGSVC